MHYPLFFCLVAVYHGIIGIALLSHHDLQSMTALIATAKLDRIPLGILFCLSALSALSVCCLSFYTTHSFMHYALFYGFIPQQCLLSIQVLGPLSAIGLGQYGGGVIRSRWFVGIDQSPLLLLFMGHLIAIPFNLYSWRSRLLEKS